MPLGTEPRAKLGRVFLKINVVVTVDLIAMPRAMWLTTFR